jgi:hypothetical protein
VVRPSVAAVVENVGAGLLIAAAARVAPSLGMATAGLWLILWANLSLEARGKDDR